jgi:hypothetical protein
VDNAARVINGSTATASDTLLPRSPRQILALANKSLASSSLDIAASRPRRAFMEMPSQDTPADAYLTRSNYSIARVAADAKAAGNESALESAHSQLLNGLREQEDLEAQVQRKEALFDAADEALDDDVEEFELHLLGAVKKNRDNPKYRRYFKDGLRAVTTAEARQQEPKLVSDMLQSMTEDANDPVIGAIVTTWLPKMTASRNNVIAAEAALTTAENSLNTVKNQKVPALMAIWREKYKELEGKLLVVFADNPKRVARFFKPFRKNRASSKSPTSPTPPNTP